MSKNPQNSGDINGVLLVDKPSGITSHDIVGRLRRLIGQKAVGHAGTLDPLASGLMVLLLGEGTKISDYLLNGDKSYEVQVHLGLETDSWDRTGEVLKQEDLLKTQPEVIEAALSLAGDMELPVPAFSAVKRGGEKLYEKARKGEVFELPQRTMSFYDIEALGLEGQIFTARLSCQKGGFIRSWSYELGKKLGTVGCIHELRRLKSSPFDISSVPTLEAIETHYTEKDELLGLIPIEQCLPHLRGLSVKGRDETLCRNGQIPHSLQQRFTFEQKESLRTGKAQYIRVVSADSGALVAIWEIQPGKGLKVKRVFTKY